MQSSAKSTIATGLVVFTKIKYDTCREFVLSSSKGIFVGTLQARRIKQPFHINKAPCLKSVSQSFIDVIICRICRKVFIPDSRK